MSTQGIYKIRKYWHENLSFKLSSLFLGVYLLCVLLADALPLPAGPNQLDLLHLYQGPFRWHSASGSEPPHWLGTDGLGRDVLANLVYGCRTSFLISFTVMGMATTVGVALGSAAGFLGDRSIRVSFISLLLFLLAAVAVWFYAFYRRQYSLSDAAAASLPSFAYQLLVSLGIAAGVFVAVKGMHWMLARTFLSRFTFLLPLDQIVLKLIEVITVIPRLILILCLSAFMYPSLPVLMLLIAVSYWAGPARLVRAELLRVNGLSFMQAAKAAGLPRGQIYLRHALPNTLGSVAVAFTFGVTGLLALESTLSFLGIGVPSDLPSWGRMMAGIRSNLSAWWLVVLPGTLLSLTVLSLQTCSFYLQKAFLSPGP
jgi:peptide/nickel transport system permease protein